MATEIKAIKCPQCGSPQKTEIKLNQYRCDNCQTEYFLDDDRLIIQHDFSYPPPAAPAAPFTWQRGHFVGLFLVVAAFTILISWLVRPHGSASSSAGSAARDKGYFLLSGGLAVPLAGSGQPPRRLLLTSRRYHETGQPLRDELYASFYDPGQHQEIRAQRLPGGSTEVAYQYKARTFSNGALYVILNRTTVYQVDKAALRLTDVTSLLLREQPALQAGAATVDFLDARKGDGLAILTNDGQSLFYYPLVNRIYTAPELRQAMEGAETLLPGATNKTSFAFAYPCAGNPMKLLAVRYQDNGGGPKEVPELISCYRQYRGYDAAAGRAVYQYQEIGDITKAQQRITAYRDLTPGRRYFGRPDVLYADAQQQLLTCHATAGPTAPLTLQCLDPATGRVRWTTPLAPRDEVYELVPCQAGFLGTGIELKSVLFDANGKITSRFVVDSL